MDCQKDLFSLPEGQHYLNCAYMSPLLRSVELAGREGLLKKRKPWEITPDDFFEDSNTIRSLFARLINAESGSQIAILPSASYGLSTVAKNLPPNSNKKIIVAGQQFPSNIYPWIRYCRESGSDLHIVKPPENPAARGEAWNLRILDAIDTDTLLVALGNVHWTDGTLFDLAKIGKRIREVDALFVVDGTQSIGALPFNQQKVQADAVVCAGYKWLMGPYSIGLGYFGERFLDGIPLEEGWLERKDSKNFSELVNYADSYQPGAVRFDVGESSNFILVPMMIQALRQLLNWKPAEIQTYCQSLTADLAEQLQAYQFKIENPNWRAHHLFGIYLPEQVHPQELQQQLTEKNIYVSIRGSAIRISPHVYNDENDIELLQKVVTSML